MNSLLWIMISTFLISLISFIGIFTLALKDKFLDKIILLLVSLSAGALMGGAFIHLLPESVELSGGLDVFFFVLVGFALFFLIEKVLHWRHCHKGECKVHTFTYMNLIGDSIHNFIDGLIMATSFIISIPLGMTTTMAIALHEIPQEIGDFGVLIYGGFTKKKALVLNFLTALTAVLGGLIGFFISNKVENVKLFILPFAAGGFLYIAASDLIPEIRKETSLKKSMIYFGIFILGIFIMYAVTFIAHE
jgi:zinc and cadmium transporter